MKDKMTVIEAAGYLGATRQKIHRLIRDGKLAAEKNPLDERIKLIAIADLDRLKKYPRAAKPKPKQDSGSDNHDYKVYTAPYEPPAEPSPPPPIEPVPDDWVSPPPKASYPLNSTFTTAEKKPPQESVKFSFTGQNKDYGWAIARELNITISQAKRFMEHLPGLESMSYEELKKAAAKKFKKEI